MLSRKEQIHTLQRSEEHNFKYLKEKKKRPRDLVEKKITYRLCFSSLNTIQYEPQRIRKFYFLNLKWEQGKLLRYSY